MVKEIGDFQTVVDELKRNRIALVEIKEQALQVVDETHKRL